jgi:hypothetical protein
MYQANRLKNQMGREEGMETTRQREEMKVLRIQEKSIKSLERTEPNLYLPHPQAPELPRSPSRYELS